MQADKSVKRFNFISAAGNESAAASIEIGQCPEAIVFELINPLGALKQVAALNRDDGADFGEHG